MSYRPALVAALLVSLLALHRPGFAGDFAHNFGGTLGGLVVTYGVTADAAGNSFVAGSFTGETLVLGNTTLGIIGTQDAFVAKLDPAGNVIWARNFGGIGAVAAGNAIAIDGSGNVVAAGNFYVAGLTTPPLGLSGSSDGFVVKLDSAGSVIWARNAGGPAAWTEARSIAVDTIGNVVVAGQYHGADLTDPPLAKIGITDTFVIKLDVNGAPIWVRNYGGTSANAYGQAIAVDASGNAYLGGYFDNFDLTTPILTKIGDGDAFVIKISSSGATSWAKNFGGSGIYVAGKSIAVDPTGHAVLAGYFEGGNLTSPALPLIGTRDGFAIRLDVNGGATWSRNFGGPGVQTHFVSTAIDGTGNVLLGGEFGGGNLTMPALALIGPFNNALAIKVDASGGTLWAKGFGSAASAAAIAADGSGNVHLGGWFSGPLTTPSLPHHWITDAFAFKLDPAGNVVWADAFWSWAPGGFAEINATSFDATGNTCVCGHFTGATITIGNSTLQRIGRQDAFAAKLDLNGNILWARNFGGPGAYADCRGLAIDAAGNVFLAGDFYDGDLTTPSLVRIGLDDVFAIKLDSNGASVWTTNFGGNGANAVAFGMTVDTFGHVYVSGYFNYSGLTTPALPLTGTVDAFVFKLDASSGGPIWATNFGGVGAFAWAASTAVDGTGNVYVGGSFSGGNLSVPPLTKIGQTDGFALKLAPNGNVAWATQIGGSVANVHAQTIAIDNSSTVTLAGSFGVADLTSPPLARIGTDDAFVIKLDSAGANLWSRNVGGIGATANAASISVDGAGNTYVAGIFYNANLTTPALQRIGILDGLLIKLDSTGSIVGARNFGGSAAQALFRTIAIGGNGGVSVGGSFNSADLTNPPLALIGSIDAVVINGGYYTVTYVGNGNTGGTVPHNAGLFVAGENFTVARNGNLVKSGSGFAGWNTAADGSGVQYSAGQALAMPPSNLVLHAQWIVGGPAVQQSAGSRKAHGSQGTSDLPLSLAP